MLTTNINISSVGSLLGPEESSSISKSAASVNRDLSTLDTKREFYPVTTASPVNIPHHQPFFKSLLLHERLLTRDFQGYQHFFQSDGPVGSTVPGSVPAPDSGDPVTQLVPHEDAPAYSDIATTATAATAAATSPLTTFSPTTPRLPIAVPQKKSSHDWTRGEEKVSPTTDSLTTQVPLSGGGSARSANAPSSIKLDTGEAKETTGKTKPSRADPLLNPPSTLREHGTTTASTVTPTSTPVTAVQTAGKLVFSVSHRYCRTSKCHNKTHPPAANPRKTPNPLPKAKSKMRLLTNSTPSSRRTGKFTALLNLHAALYYSFLQQE